MPKAGKYSSKVVPRPGSLVTQTEPALWLTTIWLAIAGSRTVGQWLAVTGIADVGGAASLAERNIDGSPFDRNLLAAMLFLAVIVLARRGARVRTLLLANGPILIFFLYCLVSVVWSDFSDIAFKRWIKALGDVAMVLIVVTDKDPSAAVKKLLSRVGFVLVPASLLLDKYYAQIGKGFTPAGDDFFMGVANSKNELGGVCMLFGLGAVWRLVQLWRESGKRRSRKPLFAQAVLLVFVVALFWTAHTMTALVCFLLASVLIVATSFRSIVRRRWLVHAMVGGIVAMCFTALFLDVGAGMVQSIGKDPTLTGRTAVWDLVFSLTHNRMLGAGFESFWLGPRLEKIWSVYWWHPNEAHNGYIEVFLNLGYVGVGLLIVLILTGYRNVINAFRSDPDNGRLRLAYLTMAVVYNFTESAVRMMHPVWICFLLATVMCPGGWRPAKSKKSSARAASSTELTPSVDDMTPLPLRV